MTQYILEHANASAQKMVQEHHGNGSAKPNYNIEAKDIRVLMYHRIVSNKVTSKDNGFSVHQDIFRKQLQTIDRWGYTTITFVDYNLYLRGKIKLPKKPIIITIDDGYLDTYTLAYPVLQEFGMKAVIYVIGDPKLDYNKWDEDKMNAPAKLMNRDQIKELHREGHEIGAHTLTHPDLRSLSLEKANQEILMSREVLQQELGTAPISFCYPYGGSTPQTVELVKESGFQFACSVDKGPVEFGKSPYLIRRIAVRNNMIEFALRLKIPLRWIDLAKKFMTTSNFKDSEQVSKLRLHKS